METTDPADSSPGNSTETLMPQVYEALRQLASQRVKRQYPGQSLSGTELVHEAYLRLSKEGDGPKWANRSQFFAAAAEAMRRILIDRIRSKNRIKRGGRQTRVEIDPVDLVVPTEEKRLLEINSALDQLADSDPQSADLVKMRFFAGMTLVEIASVSGVSVRTVTRQWAFARAWLAEYMSE